MTEKPTKHATAEEKERAARARREALALRHALALPVDDRPDACAKLADAALALPSWLRAVRQEADRVAVTWPDACAMLARPELKADAAALEAAGVDLSAAVDPAEAREAYAAAIAETKRAGEEARIRSARKMLDGAAGAQTDAERLRLMRDAGHELTRADVDAEKPLAEVWNGHLAALGAEAAGPDQVLRLNVKMRGPWAAWINSNLGSRRGLEPGETFILGGGPEAGKTSFAALLAVDALAVQCPVLFWQLELSREETLEHLIAQLPCRFDEVDWWRVPYWKRARRELPKEWAELLTVPRWPEPEEEGVRAALERMARETERARRAGKKRHKCRGLVIVDYAQLLTLGDPRPREAQHEILATAASRLAKSAAENGVCLLLLSQLNKQEQRDGATEGTALAGADLARMAHRVALMQKADEEGKPCGAGVPVARDDELGEARLITWTKRRGMHYTEDGHAPVNFRRIWDGGRCRALHGGEEAQSKTRADMRMPE